MIAFSAPKTLAPPAPVEQPSLETRMNSITEKAREIVRTVHRSYEAAWMDYAPDHQLLTLKDLQDECDRQVERFIDHIESAVAYHTANTTGSVETDFFIAEDSLKRIEKLGQAALEVRLLAIVDEDYDREQQGVNFTFTCPRGAVHEQLRELMLGVNYYLHDDNNGVVYVYADAHEDAVETVTAALAGTNLTVDPRPS